MKILIAVPCMDQVSAQFAQSLACLNKMGECSVAFLCGSLIYDSRNKLATQAVEIGADYVMWFDSDMTFAPDTLAKLMEHMKDKDIVSGLYFRRVPPFAPVIFSKVAEGTWEGYDDYPSELFEVEGIGFGCVLMKTEVLIDVLSKYMTCFSPVYNFGEDLSFCIRAREIGYKIWCDPSIVCGHIGHSIISKEFYEAYRGTK